MKRKLAIVCTGCLLSFLCAQYGLIVFLRYGFLASILFIPVGVFAPALCLLWACRRFAVERVGAGLWLLYVPCVITVPASMVCSFYPEQSWHSRSAFLPLLLRTFCEQDAKVVIAHLHDSIVFEGRDSAVVGWSEGEFWREHSEGAVLCAQKGDGVLKINGVVHPRGQSLSRLTAVAHAPVEEGIWEGRPDFWCAVSKITPKGKKRLEVRLEWPAEIEQVCCVAGKLSLPVADWDHKRPHLVESDPVRVVFIPKQYAHISQMVAQMQSRLDGAGYWVAWWHGALVLLIAVVVLQREEGRGVRQREQG
jgi:hypothetical protein